MRRSIFSITAFFDFSISFFASRAGGQDARAPSPSATQNLLYAKRLGARASRPLDQRSISKDSLSFANCCKGVLAAAFIALLFAAQAQAQQRVFFYRFENARFDVSFVEIKIYEDGRGDLRYKKRDENDDITIDMRLLPATVNRLEEFYNSVGFLGSEETYQSDKQFPHLGAVTLGMQIGDKTREAEFNYTNNRTILRLVELYRAIENQQRKLFELKLARQFTPLDLPRQLKSIEADLKSSRIAEPEQLVPLLSEIELDDSLPLIARNSAGKLAAKIKKKG